MDISAVLESDKVKSMRRFNELVTYLRVLFAAPAKILTSKVGLAWLCTNNPTGNLTSYLQASFH